MGHGGSGALQVSDAKLLPWLHRCSNLLRYHQVSNHTHLSSIKLETCLFSSADSFARVSNWLAEVKQFARSEATYMIFGNKCDMDDSG